MFFLLVGDLGLSKIIGLHHVALCCQEKRSLSVFYEQMLGAIVVKSFNLDDELFQRIFDKKGSAEVFVYETRSLRFEIFVTDVKMLRGCAHVCIEVDDKKEFAKQCDNHQIPVKWVNKEEKRLLFVSDFSGNLFEIKEKP